jgi:hypothetical protein
MSGAENIPRQFMAELAEAMTGSTYHQQPESIGGTGAGGRLLMTNAVMDYKLPKR